MLDLPRYDAIRLHRRPLAQRLIADTFLLANYGLGGVRIIFEGDEKLPDEPVIFAMNHTDKYNFWPFQYRMKATRDRFTATWVKGKNYDHPLVARFMELTNNIPLASRGYLLTRDFVNVMGRHPSDEEYASLRSWITAAEAPSAAPERLLTTPRDILGRPFDPSREDYAAAMNGLSDAMMERFVGLNQRAVDIGLDLLVFPQGTTSVQLSRGHIGLAQIALHTRLPIVPISCNHCDRIYPGGSPWAKGGEVIYRFGAPLRYEELSEFHVAEDFAPFTGDAEARHRERFQGLVDHVMDRIDENLDPRHRYSDDRVSDGKRGARRFVN